MGVKEKQLDEIMFKCGVCSAFICDNIQLLKGKDQKTYERMMSFYYEQTDAIREMYELALKEIREKES